MWELIWVHGKYVGFRSIKANRMLMKEKSEPSKLQVSVYVQQDQKKGQFYIKITGLMT